MSGGTTERMEARLHYRGLSPHERGNLVELADLDRVAAIIARPQAVLRDRHHGSLVYVGPAVDGQRLVKVVIRPASYQDLKMGVRGKAQPVATNYVRTVRYEDPRSMRRGQWQLLDGSMGE